MPNYQQSKIYKIVDANEEMVYVGSTCQKYLCSRMATHKANYKRLNNYCSSHDIFDKYGMENCKILLLENYPCNSKEELFKKEGEYIRQLNCVNKIISGRTQKEYNNDNKDKIKEIRKKYYDDNKDKLKEYRKEYYDDNRDKILGYKKEYYDDNRDKILGYKKEYRLKKKQMKTTSLEDSSLILPPAV